MLLFLTRKGKGKMKKDNKIIIHKSSVESTLEHKERFNAYQCGHGTIKKTPKHPTRDELKRKLRKELEK